MPGFLTGPRFGDAVRALGHPITHAGDVFELGRSFDRSPVWIHPSAHEFLGLPENIAVADYRKAAREGAGKHPFTVDAAAAGFDVSPPGLSHWFAVRRGAERVDIAVAAWDRSAGLAKCSPRELQAAVEIFAERVGVAYFRSPGSTAIRVLRAVHRDRHTHRVLDASAEQPLGPGDYPPEEDFAWFRPLDLTERGMAFLHGFDVNGQYLAAASSAELGFGEPEHLIPKRAGGALGWDVNLPGYWRADVSAPTPADYLPDPFDPRGRGLERRARWLTTPTIALAAECGVLGAIHEAYVWPQHHRYLGPWYERLRDARAALIGDERDGAAHALRLVKRCYQHGIGFLDGDWLRPGDELFRPDWRHTVIGRARANLYRAITRAVPRPFAVNVDAVWIASDEPEPSHAISGLRISDQLGHFKPLGTVSLPDVLEQLSDADSPRKVFRVLRGAMKGGTA